MGANQNAQILPFTDLVNTKYIYPLLCALTIIALCIASLGDKCMCYQSNLISG